MKPVGPWPFDPSAGTIPCGYSERFFGRAWPVGQDPVGYAMRVVCDATCTELHGPSPVYPATVQRQLDALACDYVYSFPATSPELVRWKEAARFVDVDTQLWSQLGNRIAIELARLPSPSWGSLRIEEISTYLRTPVGDGQPTTVAIVGAGDAIGEALLPTNSAETVTEPFPFPIEVANGQIITWEWHLVHEWRAQFGQTAPFMSDGGPANQVIPPGSYIHTPWTDNRFGWGGQHSRRHQYTVGGFGLVRLFVVLTASSEQVALPALRVGGGLVGFWQSAGPRGAALINNTIRTG